MIASATAVAYGLAWLAIVMIPAVITWLKGQRLVFFAGLLFAGIIWLVAAMRLARPDSYWARRFYGPDKLARSKRRY
jgi:hypothetical protein